MGTEHIIGHEKVIEGLKRVIKNNKVSHSYLFVGEESIGKKIVAFSFAKTLLCEKKGLTPCNVCDSCIKFDTHNHPDFFFIKPEKDIIRKVEIENIIKNIMTKPYEGNKKVFIIDDSYKMHIKAQNCFLKTLEEPPEFAYFILISSNSRNLLPTIVSRCEIIKFFSAKKDEIIDFLITEYDKTKEEAEFISSFSRGRVGKAIELSTSDDFFEKREKTIQVIDEILNGDKLKVFNSYNFFKENEEDCEEILDIITYWFRDLIIYKELGESELIVNKDKIELLSSQTFLSKEKINDIINTIQTTKENISHNINFQLSLEIMLLNMQEV